MINETNEHTNSLQDVASIVAAQMQDLGATLVEFGPARDYHCVFHAQLNYVPVPVVCAWDGKIHKAREIVDMFVGKDWHQDIPNVHATKAKDTHGARPGWVRFEGVVHVGFIFHLPCEWQTVPLCDISSLVQTDDVLWTHVGLHREDTMSQTTIEEMMKIADFYSRPVLVQEEYIYEAILADKINYRSII